MDVASWIINIMVSLTLVANIVNCRSRNATPSAEHRLIKDLFRYYDSAVRPRYNSSHTVMVKVRFSLQQINDLDEKRQILKMSGWLTAEWQDEYLKWNPDDYGGMTAVVVEPRRMWIPKLAIGNSANKLFDADHYKRFWVTVRHTGDARWQPGGVFAIACALDMNFYPFDDQKCTMEIETWVYTADKVNLTSMMPEVGLDTFVSHGEWTIMKTAVTSENKIYKYYQDEYFPEVYFTIFIRRKYTFYFMYILLPCLMLSGVLLMIFVLPADSGEKVSLGVSILVAISVFLLLVAGNVPDTSDAVPIIAIYLTYFMMATTLSVAFSVLVIKLHYSPAENTPPAWLRILIFHYLARLVCMPGHYKYGQQILNKSHQEYLMRRDATWSETVTEEIKSQTISHGTLTPDGTENYEMTQQRRRTREGNTSDSNIQCISLNRQNHNVQDTSCHDDDGPVRHPPNEWRKLAEVLDRFFFWLFLLFLIIPTAAILGFVRLFKPTL